jgi:hypothetical protein
MANRRCSNQLIARRGLRVALPCCSFNSTTQRHHQQVVWQQERRRQFGVDGARSISISNCRNRSNSGDFRKKCRPPYRSPGGASFRCSSRPNQRSGLRILASIAIDPLSHCASKTPLIGIAQSLVSLSRDSQSHAATESDHKITPMSRCGHAPCRPRPK